MATYDPADRGDAILWARYVINNKEKYVICDTETTGLKEDDEIIQMAIIDLDRNVLFNSLLKPKLKKSISREATLIHGLRKNDLIDAPCFETAVHKFLQVTKDKTILLYNAEFDVRLLQQTCYANRCDKFPLSYWCVMKEYSKYIGQWNDYHNDYKYQKLRGGDHTALGDCFATLATIERMSKTSLPKINPTPKTEPENKVDTKNETLNKPVLEPINVSQQGSFEYPQKTQKRWWQFWN